LAGIEEDNLRLRSRSFATAHIVALHGDLWKLRAGISLLLHRRGISTNGENLYCLRVRPLVERRPCNKMFVFTFVSWSIERNSIEVIRETPCRVLSMIDTWERYGSCLLVMVWFDSPGIKNHLRHHPKTTSCCRLF
jgi:hypothetical protein